MLVLSAARPRRDVEQHSVRETALRKTLIPRGDLSRAHLFPAVRCIAFPAYSKRARREEFARRALLLWKTADAIVAHGVREICRKGARAEKKVTLLLPR